MVRLRQGDLERVLTVVRSVATARDPDEFARASVEQLSEIVPSDVITMSEVDPSAGRTVFTMEPETFPIPPGSQRRLAEMADQHPLIHHTASTGDGSARRISDFWTQKSSTQAPFIDCSTSRWESNSRWRWPCRPPDRSTWPSC